MTSTPSFARITNPSDAPSGTSTVFAKPSRSTQNGRHGSIFSTVSSGLSFLISLRAIRPTPCKGGIANLRPTGPSVLEKWNRLATARSGGPQPLRRRPTGELSHFTSEMRLIVKAGVERERGPIDGQCDASLRQDAPYARHAGEGLRRHPDVQRESAGQML